MVRFFELSHLPKPEPLIRRRGSSQLPGRRRGLESAGVWGNRHGLASRELVLCACDRVVRLDAHEDAW